MKRLIATTIMVLTLLLSGAPLLAAGNDPLDLTIKEIYLTPSKNASLVFKIPIEVRLLDISSDCNWYKVKISFSLGPLCYTYTGWVNIPVGQVVAEKLTPQKMTND
jgi:hypothetical protein